MVKRKIQPLCVLSVDLTSDLAEYGKEESAESTPCGGSSVCVRVCVSKCVSMVFRGLYVSSFLCGWREGGVRE